MKHVNELMADFVVGGLDVGTRLDVEAHLAVCPSCRREIDEVQKVFGALSERAFPEPPAYYFASLRARILARLDHPRWDWLRTVFTSRLFAPAAAGGLALALLLQVQLFPERETSRVGILSAVDQGEILDAVRWPHGSAGGLQIEDLAATSSAVAGLERELARVLLSSNGSVLWNDVGGTDTRYFLESLQDDELNELLQRLKERTII
jgi:hypothetical protein